MVSFVEKGGKFELRSQLCYYNCKQIYLETHFRHEFSILGRFGQSVEKEKNISNSLKYPANFFYVFVAQMKEKIKSLQIVASRLKQLHQVKLRKIIFFTRSGEFSAGQAKQEQVKIKNLYFSYQAFQLSTPMEYGQQ